MSGTRYPIRQEDSLIFSFISEGTKGRFEKLGKYDQIDEVTFNLGFGDRIGKTRNFDNKVVTDNGDIREVLATVVATLDIFFENHPDMFVFIRGSNRKRTRIYCWIVKNNFEMFKNNYQFWGGLGWLVEEFQPDKDYDRILISKM